MNLTCGFLCPVPPYGRDTVPEMKTIYDFKTGTSPEFLDTQCEYAWDLQAYITFMLPTTRTDRMPVPIGDFISGRVYDSRLESRHTIEDIGCTVFVDVSKTGEAKRGSSWRVSTKHVPDRSSF